MDRSCHPEVTERRQGDDAPEAAEPVAPPSSEEALLAQCSMEFVRAGGPGGQHRNRRETGVRLTHLPTGVVVMATERRSQLANRKLAVERMAEKLEKRARKPKPRKPTRKSRGVRARELDTKRKQSEKKAGRRKLE